MEALRAVGHYHGAARRLGVDPNTLRAHLRRTGDWPEIERARAETKRSPTPDLASDEDPLTARVRGLIGGRKQPTLVDLSDSLDVSPRRVKGALEELRAQGYRIPEEPGDTITLEPVNPDKVNLHHSLLDGTELTVGVVSDTHLASSEEALPELELAYDHFEREGITEVWHAGDLVAGRGIFKSQDAEVKCNTFERQVDYAVENYPRRNGITTRMISGNHDVEGDFGRIGANPVVAVANQRDDVEFLGDFSAWVQLPGGAWVHLLHGKGGASYALSYRLQKMSESYPGGRKPAVVICGHFHKAGWFESRGIQCMYPGCFEWKTKMLERMGLTPSVGFYVLKLTIGDDGSLVGFNPHWKQIYEGRTAG